MRISSKLLLISVMTLIVTPTAISAGNSKLSTKSCDKPMLSVFAVEGYYADLDNDGTADDVYGKVIVDLMCGNRYKFDYKVTLTLPSGFQISDYLLINTRLNTLIIETIFYNYALEAGDYIITAEGMLSTGGGSYSSSEIIFDPPGGVTGTGSTITTVSF